MMRHTPSQIQWLGIVFFLLLLGQLAAQNCEGEIGQVIFFEDFGSGDGPGPSLPPGTTSYNYGSIGGGNYVVTNTTGLNGSLWHTAPDHTPGDDNGYCLLFDASSAPGVFYSRAFDELCANTNYTFSCYVANIVSPSACGGNSIEPDLRFTLLDPATLDELGSVTTGGIPTTSEISWNQYSISFTTNPGQEEVLIEITNNASGGCGNDLAIDDFSFSICNPVQEQEFDLCTLPGGSLQVGNELLTSPGFYETIIDLPNSCHDSIVYTTLTGTGTLNTEEYFLVCPGDSIDIDGFFIVSDTVFVDTLAVQGECLEIITTTIEFGFPNTSEELFLCAGDSLFLAGAWVSESGIFQDTFVSYMGCDSFHITDVEFRDFFVEASVPAGPLFPGETSLVMVTSNPVEEVLYQWNPPLFFSCDTCANPLFAPLRSGDFSVIGYDPIADCADTLQFFVLVDECQDSYLPNIFSPNYDGVNDVFQAFLSNCVVQVNTFQVYDRWGNAVYVQQNIPPDAARWDGRFRGQDAPAGVYVYYLEVELYDGRAFLLKGDVTLVR
jgi:gliding motility-associated-like protein